MKSDDSGAGIVNGELLLDLEYEEDSRAEVDMNFVVTGRGLLIEVQGTAEKYPFNRTMIAEMTDLAMRGVAAITEKQREILGELN